MGLYYILDGHTPVPITGLYEWGRYMSQGDRHVALTYIGTLRISTVFLGLDHQFGDKGPPLLFETMIFDDGADAYQTRCSTWEEAERMHAAAVDIATSRVRDADAMIQAAILKAQP